MCRLLGRVFGQVGLLVVELPIEYPLDGRLQERLSTIPGSRWPAECHLPALPRAVGPRLGCAKLSFLRLSFISFLFRIEHLYSCPNGATVLPALGNAQGTGARVEDFRPNGPTNRPRGMVGPLGRHENRRATAPLGVAQGWENGWAFGPSDGAADGTQRALLLSRSLSKFAKFSQPSPRLSARTTTLTACLATCPSKSESDCATIEKTIERPLGSRFVRVFYCLITLLLLCSPAVGREIVVDNVAGDDRFTGEALRDPGGSGGPVRTLAKALRLAGPGDTILLVKNDTPYHGGFSLAGSRHSGTSDQPFTIRGNGAVLDGSTPAPAKKWESYKGAIFRLRGRPMGYTQLFLNGRPAVRVFAAQSAKSPPKLQPRQWCSVGGRIYFCVDKTKLPDDYKLSYAHEPTGITLFHVNHVRIADLTVQGFQVDGLSLYNSARNVTLSNVTCRGNGRSGVAVGGASLLTIEGSLLGNNGQAQLLSLPYSETHVRNTHLLSNSAPGLVDQGGRVYIDGRRVEGGGMNSGPPPGARNP